MGATPTDADIILEAIENRLLDLHTSFPGTVLRYDRQKQTADIALSYKRALLDERGDKVTEDFPTLPNVPVVFPVMGPVSVHADLIPGNRVMVNFAERNLSQWQETGETGDPGDLRMHGLSGAWAVPGGLPGTEPLTEVAQDGGLVLAAPTSYLGAATATHPHALGDILKTHLEAVKTYLDSHTHPHALGPGTTSPPAAPSPVVAPIESLKHKLDG